jgi:hypothetical protein
VQRGSAVGNLQIGDAVALTPRNGRRLAEKKLWNEPNMSLIQHDSTFETNPITVAGRFLDRDDPTVGRSCGGAGGAAAARLE